MGWFLLAIVISSADINPGSDNRNYKEIIDTSTVVRIKILYSKDSKQWHRVRNIVRKSVFYLNKWYGKYPQEELIIVDDTTLSSSPGVVYISGRRNYLFKALEEEIIEKLTRSWIHPMNDSGFVLFAKYRYFETIYGHQGISKFPLLEIDHGLYAHFSYLIMYNKNSDDDSLKIIKKSYVFRNLKEYLGAQIFDSMFTAYLVILRHKINYDFWQFVDRFTGKNLASIYNDFVNRDGFCDLYIARHEVESTGEDYLGSVEIGNHGNVIMPYKVVLKTKSKVISYFSKCETTFTYRLKNKPLVIIDPNQCVLERSKKNNRSSSLPIITFKINRNILERYPIYFAPYLWYSTDKGIETGGFIQGGLPLFPKKLNAKNLIFARSYYAWRKRKAILEFTYSTPIRPFYIDLEGTFDANENRLDLRLEKNKNFIRCYWYDLFDTTDLETRDFEEAHQFSVGIGLQKDPFTVQVDQAFLERKFSRVIGRFECELSGKIPISIRTFAGGIFGDPPIQDKIYLSGSLYPSLIGRIITQTKGPLSAQEHLNYKGGPWLVGYYGQHEKGKYGYGLNLKVFYWNFFIFGDLGDVADEIETLSFRYDLGVGLKIYQVSIQFPIYISDPLSDEKNFALRWLISL